MGLQHKDGTPARSGAALESGAEKKRAAVAAIIVLFHPDGNILRRLMESVDTQVEKIFLIDNTPGREGEMQEGLVRRVGPVFYHASGSNRGIAAAQNTGIAQAIREGYTHVLLLDQDSWLPEGAVESLLAAERALLEAGKRVAAVAPVFIEEKSGKRSYAVRPGLLRVRWCDIPVSEAGPVESDYVIASGSLIRSCVLAEVGTMRDELFIDWVDVEWAYRAKSRGYATFMVPSVVMMHSIGDATGNLMGRRFNLHSPARNYYIVRNAAYLLRNGRMSWRWRVTMLTYIPKYILVHTWLSRRRLKNLVQMLHAVGQGIAGRMGPVTAI